MRKSASAFSLHRRAAPVSTPQPSNLILELGEGSKAATKVGSQKLAREEVAKECKWSAIEQELGNLEKGREFKLDVNGLQKLNGSK